MASLRIFFLFSLASLGGALAVLFAGAAGAVSPGRALLGGALLVALAGLCVLWPAADLLRRRTPEPPAAPPTSVRTSFGPAMDETDSVALYTVDGGGRIGYFNRGAERLFGQSARDAEGKPAGGTVVPQSDEPGFLDDVRQVLDTGKPRPARRTSLTDGSGHRLETIVTAFPLLRYGKPVEVALLHVDARPSGGSEERLVRLLDSCPIGLLGVDGWGRIEAVNHRLSEWTGRRADALEGTDVARCEVLPVALRERISGLSLLRGPQGTPAPPVEQDVMFLTADGNSRPLHAIVATRADGGADVVLLDGGSRRRLLTELEAARDALAEAREAAAETIESTTRDLRAAVQEMVKAVRRVKDERTGPVQRAEAHKDIDESGSRFLARVAAAQTEEIKAGPERRAKGSRRPRVLLVEDNDENRDLLAHMLRSRRADVVAFGSGREALDAAARMPFDLVLLDIQMPEMDGYQVLRRLRALPGGDMLPVVALTALTSDLVREKCEAEGMDDFVGKPVTLRRIGELLARWAGKRRLPADLP